MPGVPPVVMAGARRRRVGPAVRLPAEVPDRVRAAAPPLLVGRAARAALVLGGGVLLLEQVRVQVPASKGNL